jgi:hypothetical protein
MAEANPERREVNARIVYWGIEGSGKASNLRSIHGKLRPDHRGRLEAVATPLDPSVCWYRLPIELGEIAGVRTRIQIVAVPGGPEQAPTRKQLLDRVDGVVFVVDARRDRIDDNVASFEELRTALGAYGRALENVPLVVQYNHHDETDPFVLEELHRKLDVRGAAAFEAKAHDGTGVLPTLTTISKRVVRQLRENEQAAAAAPARPAAPPPPAPVPAAPAPAAIETPARTAPPPAPREAAPSLFDEPIAEASPPAPAAPPPQREGATTAPRTRLPDLRTTAIVLDPEPLDIEQAALAADVELVDERDHAVERAQSLLDPSWSELSEKLDEIDPLSWRLVSAGAAEIVGTTTLRIPLAVADAVGRELRFRLTVSLEPLLEE